MAARHPGTWMLKCSCVHSCKDMEERTRTRFGTQQRSHTCTGFQHGSDKVSGKTLKELDEARSQSVCQSWENAAEMTQGLGLGVLALCLRVGRQLKERHCLAVNCMQPRCRRHNALQRLCGRLAHGHLQLVSISMQGAEASHSPGLSCAHDGHTCACAPECVLQS